MSDVMDVAEVAPAPEPPVPMQAPHIPESEVVAAPVPSNGDAAEGGDQAEASASKKVEKKKRERAQPVPVEISEGGEEGRPKRERKQTEVFKVVEAPAAKKVVETLVPGSGIVLGDYPYFCKGLDKLRGDDQVVTDLHSLIYGNKGKKLETKKNLRLFSGFAADVNTEEKTAKMIENKKKWTVSVLKSSMELFGMEKSGTREELIARLVSFLAKPEVLRSESSFGGGKKSGTKRKSKGGKESKAKKPKRPPSGYILFTTANREKVKAENPDADFKGMSQLLGDKWKNLSDTEKAVWNAQSAELKAAAGAAAGGDEGEEQEEEEEEEGEETEDEVEEEEEGAKETAKDDDEELFDEDDDGYGGDKGLSAVKGNGSAASASSSSSSADA